MYFYSGDMVYGVSVYDKFIDEINRFDGNHSMTFKSLQDFLRHKKYMLDRFAYIEKLYEVSDKCKNEIERYNEVYKLIDTARSLGIKYDMKAGRTPAIGLSKNPQFLSRLKEILTQAKKYEVEILNNIYDELAQGVILKHNVNEDAKTVWDFPSSRFISDISNCRFFGSGDDVFACDITGHDPFIIYDVKHRLNGDNAKYIYAKYRTTCDSETAQFYFTTNSHTTFSEEQSKVYTISSNAVSYEYIIDMSDKPEWKGMIGQMRFDPVGNDNKSSNGECMVEYVEINDRLPVYGSRKDFIKTQGVNNWSYYTFNSEITYREMQWDDENNIWKGIQLDGLTVGAETQSSRGRYSTVRRWTCPADGRYAVNCVFNQIDNGFMTDFSIKRNHTILQKYNYNAQNNKLCGEYQSELALEKGEVIGFEFCNEDFDSTVSLNADIVISRIAK